MAPDSARQDRALGLDPTTGSVFPMLPATDSDRPNPSRWPLVGLALLSILLDAGCSRLRAFRQDDRQAFGTNTAWSDRGPDGKSSNGDPYAELAVKSGPAARPRPIANLAIGEIPKLDLKPVIDDSPPKVGDSAPLVTLQPPIVLPPFQDNATLAAHRAPARPLVASIEIRAPRIGPIGLASVLEESRKAIDALKTYPQGNASIDTAARIPDACGCLSCRVSVAASGQQEAGGVQIT